MVRATVAIAAVLGVLAVGSGNATTATAAEFGIVPGSLSIQPENSLGEPDYRAGGHPDRLHVSFELTTEGTGTAPRDMVIELSPGISGDFSAVGACSRAAFDEPLLGAITGCPDAAVGIGKVSIPGLESKKATIFNIEPAPGEIGLFGFNFLAKFPLNLRLRPDDFGLSVELRELQRNIALAGVELELWGVPADHQSETSIPRRPFLTSPAACGKPLTMTIRTRSWEPDAEWISASAESAGVIEGCHDLPFKPQTELELDSHAVDSPTGARIEVAIPPSDDPDGLSSSQVKAVHLELPDGVSISPGAADGLSTCSADQFGLGGSAKAECPPGSSVGTVEMDVTGSRERLRGDVYIGQEAERNRFRMFMAPRAPGVEAKVVGSLQPDPASGRLVASIDDLPQASFKKIDLRLRGGHRALLVTPLSCGPATLNASFVPYSESGVVDATDAVSIGSGPTGRACADGPPFNPSFTSGVSPARAGHSASFSTTLRRSSGEQLPERLVVDFPAGLIAELGSVARCEGSVPSSGSCPPGSRIGSVVAEIGSGASPATLHGDVFLTGPYRRAPFGLALSFGGALGPFNLGSLTVRATLKVDPETGQVSVATDSLPSRIEGVSIRFQTIGLDIDRPGFLRNPTSCKPGVVSASIRSVAGTEVHPENDFLLRGCSALRFRPRMSMSLPDRRGLRLHGNPGLRIAVRAPRGSANLHSADIAMPKLLGFNPSGLREICARQAALEDDCPMSSKVGIATAQTSLLKNPLSGSIYVVQPEGLGPPSIWTSMSASGIRLRVQARVRVVDGHTHTKLVGLPDAPVSKLTMRFASGEKGLLSLTRDPCRGDDPLPRVAAELEGWSRAYKIERVPLQAKCHSSPKRRLAVPRASSWGVGNG